MTRSFIVNPTPLVYKSRGRGGLDPTNYNTPMNTGRGVFILTEAQTYLNTRVPCVAIVLRVHELP
jgi:hypothetical protein